MADTRVLPFAPRDDDAELAARLAASYASLPAATPAQIAACTDGVLRDAATRTDVRGAPGTGSRWPTRRWWWGAAAAAALLIVVTLRPVRVSDGTRDTVDSSVAMDVSPEGSTTVVDGGGAVRFELRLAADAREVAIVGDFNGWDSDATPMRQRRSDGTWSVTVPVTPGVHNYAFVVDGQRWLIDPMAPQVPDGGFGPTNAVIVVGSR